jgi:hypothetical protein
MKISISLSYEKSHAISLIFGQGLDLYKHTLKFLIHEESFTSNYTYWTKDLIATIDNIEDYALNLKKNKQLKVSITKELLTKRWLNPRLKLAIKNMYLHPDYLGMKKRFSTPELFLQNLNSITIKNAISNLVDSIYSGELSTLEILEKYFSDLKL